MPYGGTNPTEDKKIERCVSDLMTDSKFKPRKGKDKKSAAIAVCKSSIMGGKMDKETFEYTPENSEQYTKGTAITNVHVFKSGKYRGKTWTKEMVEKMVENFKKLKEIAGFEPPVRIGHRTDNPIENAKNVIGYIENLRSDGNGNAYADFDITDTEGFKKIKEGTLRKRSMEFGPYETNDGKVFDEALWGVGWVDIPQVEKLAEVNVYSKPLKEEKMDNEELAKEGDSCKMADGKSGKMKMKDGKITCMPVKEMMDKEDEDIDNDSEYSQDDSQDNSTKGEDNATDKGGEEAPKEDELDEESGNFAKITVRAKNDLPDSAFAYIEAGGKKDETSRTTPRSLRHFPIHDAAHVRNALARIGQGAQFGDKAKSAVCAAAKKFKINSPTCGEKMCKDNEMVELVKETYEKLLNYEKKAKELEKEQRVSKIEALNKEAKILSGNLDIEKDFALSLSDDQFSQYMEIKNSQPSFVKLDNEQGEQKSVEPTSAAQTEQEEEKNAVTLAEKVTEKYKTK